VVSVFHSRRRISPSFPLSTVWKPVRPAAAMEQGTPPVLAVAGNGELVEGGLYLVD
jgi:hypothetical protein